MAYSRWPHRTHKASKYKGLQLPSLCLKCSQGHWSSSKHLRPIWKCLTTRTLEKSGLLPNFIAFSRLGIGQLSTPRLATLSWATAAHLPYVNTRSCWGLHLLYSGCCLSFQLLLTKHILSMARTFTLEVSEHKGCMCCLIKTWIFMAMKREPNVQPALLQPSSKAWRTVPKSSVPQSPLRHGMAPLVHQAVTRQMCSQKMSVAWGPPLPTSTGQARGWHVLLLGLRVLHTPGSARTRVSKSKTSQPYSPNQTVPKETPVPNMMSLVHEQNFTAMLFYKERIYYFKNFLSFPHTK